MLSSGSNHYNMPCIQFTWQWVLCPIAMLHLSQLLIAVCLIARILLYLILRAFILLANKLFLLSIVSFLALCTCYSIASFLMLIYSDSSAYSNVCNMIHYIYVKRLIRCFLLDAYCMLYLFHSYSISLFRLCLFSELIKPVPVQVWWLS